MKSFGNHNLMFSKFFAQANLTKFSRIEFPLLITSIKNPKDDDWHYC